MDIQTLGIVDVQAQLNAGQTTSRALVEHCLAHISEHDGKTNAIIEINPDALELADTNDLGRRNNELLGPLHGIPILIKDNIDTADTMCTTAGSLALEGSVAKQDAGIVQKLRGAGAIILGKTNLSEWANMRSIHSCSGWSSRGGQTRNPYGLDRTPSGSSSGSAVAVAAGYCVAAIGTETDGSIISPASCNSLVGIKPTVGLVSRSGIIPISHSQDTAGPLARNVADAAVMLNILAGSDDRDPACDEADARRAPDYTAFLDTGGLKGTRLGIHRPVKAYHPRASQVFEDALRVLRDNGAEIIEDISLPTTSDVEDYEDLVLTTDFKVDLNAYLSNLSDAVSVRSIADLIAFNNDHQGTVLQWFPQELLEAAESTNGSDDPAYLAARAACLALTQTDGIDRAMGQFNLDAIVAPSEDVPCLIDLVGGDARGESTTYLAAISGYPSISVPAGYVSGLPVGISFIAGAWQEPELIRLASSFEQATQHRRPPTFPAHTAT
ncbi:MAG: amidase [Rhodospirillales bacterium]|nr:amidase [Rhodospirillales bacterium]MBT4627345.1 amidase [Rhodospirillales bacterium]MBT5351109.1 amidase [Rhodospirillales bacterium]MBT5521609.1 amidase [Rhodospirillales bacterium]MBT6109567.1 amidase [Rhodospirillales bacterium]